MPASGKARIRPGSDADTEMDSDADAETGFILGFIVSTANLPVDSSPAGKICWPEQAPTNARGVTQKNFTMSCYLRWISQTWAGAARSSPALLKLLHGSHTLGSTLPSESSHCDFKLLRPAPHWSVTVGDPCLISMRINNFRIRLATVFLWWPWIGCLSFSH